uniref:Uncharacterized protein n=1 Tax=Mesorhabditis belari TaxID=2138241 RepID=A0AAF3F3M5_9BILA
MTSPSLPKKRKAEPIPDDEAALASKLFSNRILAKKEYDDDDDFESDLDDDIQVTAEETTVSKAVWHDEDDDESGKLIQIKKSKLTDHLRKTTDDGEGISKGDFQQRLRGAFTKLNSRGKQPKWAQMREEKLDDDADNLVREITHTAG